VTTYGFVRFVGAGIRLSVIHYLRPFDAFRIRPPHPVDVDGQRFPVLVRPWLLSFQSGGQANRAGTCWVEFPATNGTRGRGILTASHTVRPKHAAIGASVKLDVAPPEPGGLLRLDSPQMDAAVVEVDVDQWRGARQVHPSRVVGFKPVRLLGAVGPVDADVIEHSGFLGGMIPGEPGAEPLARTVLILNRRLSRGDSGCMGLDLEFERYQETSVTPPYLLYQGVYGTRSGANGYGLMLEQTRIVWGLDFYI
jgi:hypothetical protein